MGDLSRDRTLSIFYFYLSGVFSPLLELPEASLLLASLLLTTFLNAGIYGASLSITEWYFFTSLIIGFYLSYSYWGLSLVVIGLSIFTREFTIILCLFEFVDAFIILWAFS